MRACLSNSVAAAAAVMVHKQFSGHSSFVTTIQLLSELGGNVIAMFAEGNNCGEKYLQGQEIVSIGRPFPL